VTALLVKPSIVTAIGKFEDDSVSLATNPVPVTLTKVPLGPEVGFRVAVATTA
jgi:hypothetical protein